MRYGICSRSSSEEQREKNYSRCAPMVLLVPRVVVCCSPVPHRPFPPIHTEHIRCPRLLTEPIFSLKRLFGRRLRDEDIHRSRCRLSMQCFAKGRHPHCSPRLKVSRHGMQYRNTVVRYCTMYPVSRRRDNDFDCTPTIVMSSV